MGSVKSKNSLTCQGRGKKSLANSTKEPFTCAVHKKHRNKLWKMIKGKSYCTNTENASTDHPSEHYNKCVHTTGSLRFYTSFDSIIEEHSAKTRVKRPALQEKNNRQNVEFHQKHIDDVQCEFKPLHGDDRSEANFDIETQRNSTEQFHWLTLSSMNTERMNPSSKLFSGGICSLDKEPERYTEEPSLYHLKELSQNNETKHVDSTIPKQLYQNGSISDTDSKENNNFAFQSIDYMKSCTRYQESSDMSSSYRYSSSLPLSSHDDFVLKVEVAKKDAACQVGCGLLGPSDQTVNQDNGSTSAQSCHHSPENQSRFKLDIVGSAKCNSAAESKIVESCDDDTKQESLFCREVESIYATENEMKHLEGIEKPKNEKRATSVESSKQANCLEIDNTLFNRIDHDNQSCLKRKYETICNNEERMSTSCSKLNKVSTTQVSIKKQKLGKDNDSQIVGSPTSLKMDIEKKAEDDINDESYLKVMSDHDLFNAEEYDAVLPYSSHSGNFSENKNVSQMNEEDQQMHEKDTAINKEHTEDSIDMNNQFSANEMQVIDKKQDDIDEGFFLVEDDTSNVHGEEDQTLSHGNTGEQGLHDKHHDITHIIVDTFQGNSRSKFNGKQQEKDHNTFKRKALNRYQCKLHLIKTDVCTVKKKCGKKSGNKQRLKDTLKKTCSEKKDRFPHPEIDNEMSDENLANTMKRTPVYSVDSGVFTEFELCRSTSLSLYKSIKNESEVLKKIELLEKRKENYSTKMKLSHKRSLFSMTTCFFNIEKRLKEMSKTMIDWSYFRPGFDEYAVFPGLASYFERLQSGPPPSMEEQMMYEWFRFTSFGSSYNGNGSALVLAHNGFYHEPERGSTATRCFACHVRHSTWNSFENVEEVHRQLSHDCPHVNQNDSASGNVSITQSDSPENRPNMSALNTTEANVITSGAEGGCTNENSLASQLENMILKASSNEDRQPSQPTEDAENIHFGSSSLVLSHQSEYAVEGRTGDGYPNRPSRMPRFATTNNNLAAGARTNTTVNSHAANISAQAATSTSTGAPSTNTGSLFSATLGRPVGAGAFIRQTPGVGTPTTSASQPSQPSTPGGPTGSQPNQGPAGNSAGLNNAAAIVVQSPKHPDYASLERRTESFTGWPSYLDQTPLQMASAGFFYAGVADFTRCYCCGGGLRNWEPGDDPVLEHTRWYSTCEYVKTLKGDRYVQAVIRRQQQHLAERQRQQRLQEQRREEQLQQGVQGPDPMTSPAAPVLTEMGYSTERVREAILAVRRQTGLITIMPDQALTWILDDEEQPSNRTAASRPPSSTTSVSSRAQTSSAAATTQSVTTSTGSVAASQARTATTAATSQARTATTAATSQARTATTAATNQARTATTAATSRARTATTSATSQTKTAATCTPAVTTTTASAVSGASSITSSVSTASITAVAGSLQGEEGGSSSGVNASAATNKKADTTSQPQTSTGKKKNGRGKKGKGKPPTVAASLLEDAAPSDLDTQSLKEENEKLREMQTCKICMERPVNTTFLPCGHLVCCELCAPRLAKCPICRVRIKGTVKTFMS